MSTTKTESLKFSFLLIAALFISAILFTTGGVSALSSSSLQLSDGRPSQTSTYTFATSGLTTATTIRCIELDIGTAVDGTGDAGLDLSGVTLDSHTMVVGGWSDASVDGASDQLRATLAGGETPVASGNIVWGNIDNGSSADTTYFGVFTTYTDASCTGGNEVDTATVTLIYKDGALVSLTIDPSLTFTIAGVPSLTSVNGINTTVTSTATAVDFQNNVTSLVNGVSAHDLTVGTNGTSGYTLYIKHTGLLTNGSSDTIDNWTGTNASPTAFPVPGTEAWGYTTEDSSLAGGTADRFTNGGPFWAGFSTTNELVADANGPTASTTHSVGHQVGVSAGTEAGTYQTTIVYTVASSY